MVQKDVRQWRLDLMAFVDKEGGTLENGWEVKVKRRQSGARDITVKSTEGTTFRSVSQAALALAGVDTPKVKAPPRVNSADRAKEGKRKVKKKRLSLSSSPAKPKKGRKGGSAQEGQHKGKGEGKGGLSNGHPIEEAQQRPSKHPIFDKLLSQGRQHVAKIRRELDILEVYEAEGWRGSNRDKLKPRAEMQRAEEQMERSKEALRGIVRQCNEGEGAAIPAELYDSDGDLDAIHICCAICRRGDSTDENDLVLCDGPCRRAYHEKCCTPAFCSADLEEDADWLCPACYAKDEILDLMNEEFGTSYELDTSAADLLEDAEALQRKGRPEEGGGTPGTWAALLGGGDLVSSDSDDDYEWKGVDRNGAAADCEGLIPASTPYGSSISSSSTDDDSEEEVLQLGRRPRKKVDYVAMNSEMFGDEGEDGDGSSGSDFS